MKARTLLLLLSVSIYDMTIAQSPGWQWAKQTFISGGTGCNCATTYLSDLDIDNNNNRPLA